MKLSSRVKGTKESRTLKINERVQELSNSGKLIYNMTAGQLPFKPMPEFCEILGKQLNYLKSYQYSPISGFSELRQKILENTQIKRNISFKNQDCEFDCIISNGSKHSIYNVLGALVDPGDEVITISPFWVSYPEMIKFWGGVPMVVKSHAFDAYCPHIDDIKKCMSSKTKAIIINSPNNPAGIHYSSEWMQEFALFLKEFPNLIVISDELYSQIYYFDPPPVYFYQFDGSLLKQTVIIDGISKSFASTGLRIGHCIADKKLTDSMAKIQSQTTSGPSSLIQKALIDFDFTLQEHFLDSVKVQLRECAQIIRECYRMAGLSHSWYQTTSGFYFIVDFSRSPVFEVYKSKNQEQNDFSEEICRDILEEIGVGLVPGSAFGCSNSARMSMTLEVAPFREGLNKLIEFISRTKL